MSFNIENQKQTTQYNQVRALEYDFIRKVNGDIAKKVTPIYNVFLLICAAFFAYFVMNEQVQCYAREAKALSEPYDNDQDVTK